MMRDVKFLYYVLELLLAYILAVEVNLAWMFGNSPGIKSLQKPVVAIASEVYTEDGKLIGKYYKENRSPVALNQIAPVVIDALICTEDVRFYNHFGIDPLSSLSVFYYTAKGDNRGGSTITQQLVKNIFKTRKSGSRGWLGYLPGLKQLIYKTKEYVTALKVEAFYSKDEILNMYLNSVDFGNNAFGIKVASRVYFKTTPDKLKTEQAALLIGLLKAPSNYNPYKHPQAALERRNVVLAQMLKYNKLNKDEYKRLINNPLGVTDIGIESIDNEGSYIRSAVYRELSEWAKENEYDIFSDGLKIYTTINSRLQQHAENAVAKWMKVLQHRFDMHWQGQNPWRDENGKEIPDFLKKVMKRTEVYKNLAKRFPNNPDSIEYYLNKSKKIKVFSWDGEVEKSMSSYDSLNYYLRFLNTGLMVMDAHTGYIKAWVGGINFDYFKYDHVKQAKRQPGSTFKPFAYLAAIDNGYSPCDKFIDKPVSIKYTENGEEKVWTPHNSDWVFTGQEMSLRWAMGKSCNSVTAQLTEKVGWDKVVDYAIKLGITSPLKRVPSICLGSSDVSVYEMVGAYGTFVNEGIRCQPQLVYKIYDSDGRLITEFKPKSKRVISEETAFLMRWMFQGGLQEPGGTSGALWEFDIFRNGNEIGGKTGTSSNHSDGWYMCLTKDLVVGCWVGASERSIHFRTSALGEGSKTALPIVGQFLENMYRDKNPVYQEGKFPKPKVKITKPYICPSHVLKPDTLAADTLNGIMDNSLKDSLTQ
jgi:penicillin-binding protein 1A